MSALTSSVRPAVPALIAALALAVSLGSADGAHAKPGDGGTSGGGTTCKYGGTAGEERDFVVETYLNGKLVRTQTVSKICGKDGKWHTVGIRAASGVRPAGDAAAAKVKS